MNKNSITLTIEEIRDFKGQDFLKLLRRKGAPVVQDGKDLMISNEHVWSTYFDREELTYTVSWKKIEVERV